MYYIALSLILLGVIKECLSYKTDKWYFHFCFILIALMACLRYGQGTDYYGYSAVFKEFSSRIASGGSLYNIRTEFGYNLMMYFAILFKIPYWGFMIAVTSVMMIFCYSFLRRSCECSMTSLLFFYIYFYMIYGLSATRQGLATSVFLCFAYPILDREILQKKDILRYEFIILLASLFHSSVLVLAILPIMNRLSISPTGYLLAFIVCVGISLAKINLMSYLPIGSLSARMDIYSATKNTNFLALFSRMFLVLPLIFYKQESSWWFEKNKRYFFLGFTIYSIISFSDLTASRVWAYFYPFLFILIPCIVFEDKSVKSRYYICFYILLSVFMWLKDINATMEQGKYVNCNVFTYPYVSIFEGYEVIKCYRTSFIK